MNIRSKGHETQGFALVVTLSLMILLTIIAVGLLSLSSIALRATSKGEAQAVAQGNARLAMMIAIGELQRLAGTDRAITAPASTLQATHPSGLTGVWKPWKAADALSRSKTARASNFIQWLASSGDKPVSADPANPPIVAEGTPNSVRLLSRGSLGETAKARQQSISLPTTPVKSGRMAWVAIDEGAKARVDLFEDPTAKQPWTNVARAGSPTIDGIRHIDGWETFKVGQAEHGKLISMPSVSLGGQIEKPLVAMADPDLTVHATSLMTNPVDGGLKQDFSLFASRLLSATERSERLYRSTGLISDANAPSDPSLALLADYHQLYTQLGKRNGSVTPAANEIAPRVPARFTPYTESGSQIAVTKSALNEVLLVPSLVRVDMIFSMITRLTHGGWRNTYGADRYLLHMQYLPVITLHNPYHVPIVFEGMKVTFRNLPVGFNFIVDGQDLSTRLVALNQMYVHYAGSDSNSKDFGITLKPGIGSTGRTTTLRLEAGQTKLFGMPKVQPNWTWFDESPGTGADGTNLFDWRSNFTANFEMAPTMITTSNSSAVGFDIDWINPSALHTAKGTSVAGGARGMAALTGNESLGVKFGPYAPPAGNGKFSVGIELIRSGNPVKVGAFNVTYGDQARLNELLAKGTSSRYPQARTFPAIYPRPRLDPPIRTNTIYEEGTTPLRDYTRAKPFMIFSLAAKTTLESFLPSKTLVTGNPACNIVDIDLTRNRDPEGATPIEMVMMPISPASPAIEENRALQEGYFFSGNSALNGTPRATLLELPLLPAQSLAQFRHANLAGTGFMPFSTYTVGESVAHPQIGTDAVRQVWTDRTPMFDHTFLANEALWDRWFLSTIANEARAMHSTERPFTDVMDDFFAGKKPLLNSRYRLYGRSPKTPPAELRETTAGNPAYQKIAAHLMLNGGFNVNSTSVDAWRAVLGALRDAEIDTAAGAETVAETTPLPRVRRPADKSIEGDLLPVRQKRWQGHRRLSDEQIAKLAGEIVTEIRARGPFLSLSDFVNREVGPEGDTTLQGAIQAAIDRTTINDLVKMDGKELTAAELDNPSYAYKSVKAGVGNTASQGPGFITQGDVLSAIGSRIHVRSDTFRIRCYGEARDPSGKEVLARAWCEAVVQRVPEFTDPADQPDKTFADLNPVNAKFGRKFEIVSFRWLRQSEV
jgi:Tfp pilus assembly protein PilX